nr:kinesin light chain 3 [Ipomoea batatas]
MKLGEEIQRTAIKLHRERACAILQICSSRKSSTPYPKSAGWGSLDTVLAAECLALTLLTQGSLTADCSSAFRKVSSPLHAQQSRPPSPSPTPLPYPVAVA